MFDVGITVMRDFGYRWHDWHHEISTLRQIEGRNINFAEETIVAHRCGD